MVLSALISSLTESLIAQVVGYFTSCEVWTALERLFASHSHAHIMQTHFQLATLKKGGSSMTDYFQKFKSLSNTLVAAGQPLNEFESVFFVLVGLGTNFDSIVTTISTRGGMIPLEDLYSHLLIHEHCIEHQSATTKPVFPSANVATKSPPQCGRGRGSSSFNRGRGHGRGHGSPPLLPTPQGDSSRPICQVCNKPSHIALTCYNWFNHAYQCEPPQPMQAYFAAPSSVGDLNWYPDIGATHHITSDLNNLNL